MFTLSHTKKFVIALVKQVLDNYGLSYTYTFDAGIHTVQYDYAPEEATDELEDLAIKYNM